jgi:hypothetical protein
VKRSFPGLKTLPKITCGQVLDKHLCAAGPDLVVLGKYPLCVSQRDLTVILIPQPGTAASLP